MKIRYFMPLQFMLLFLETVGQFNLFYVEKVISINPLILI